MAITLYDSFDRALPSFPRLDTQVQTPAKPSGTTTAECTPPSCGIPVPLNHWIDLALDLCLDKHKDDLRSDFLPKPDPLVEIITEGDVADASSMHLTYPVHIAYHLVHPNDSDRRVDQLTRPLKDTTPASRVDRGYFSGRPSNKQTPGDSNNVFAVLEFKKYEGLSRREFSRGIVTNPSDFQISLRHPPYIKQASNATIYLKQATHYAFRYGTPFVALCDYNTLILLVMTQVEKTHGGQVSTDGPVLVE